MQRREERQVDADRRQPLRTLQAREGLWGGTAAKARQRDVVAESTDAVYDLVARRYPSGVVMGIWDRGPADE